MLTRFILLFFIAAVPSGWAADPIVLLKKLIIADTEAKVLALPQDSGGNVPVFVQDVTVLADAGFAKGAGQFIGKPITPESLGGLETLITQYSRDHDRMIAKVFAPVQDASNGVVRLVVVVGRVDKIVPKGNRWFSSKLLEEKLGIKSGDEIRISTLTEAINWANANPFRQVRVIVNDLADRPGTADLIVAVEDRLPLRLTASYDDAGLDVIGKNHYTAGIQFGNLWGRDHMGSYQYATTDDIKVFQSHSIDYRLPLPWRHNLQFNVGYLKVKPKIKDFDQEGNNLNAGVRYVVPLHSGEINTDFTAGIDFKRGNNSVAYNNVPLITATNDTFQLVLGLSTIRRDKRGGWMFGANVNASPGNLNARNTNLAFSAGKPVTATYITSSLSAQRLQNFDRGWSLFSRLAVQLASGGIPGGEQLSIGGASTVRGFDERIYSGDQGFVFANDFQSPVVKTALPLGKKLPPLETRFVAFYDAAQVFYKFPVTAGSGRDTVLTPLASAGLGVRMGVGSNLTLTADYGWHVTHFSRLPTSDPEYRYYQHSPDNGRGHIKVVLAF